MGIAAATGFEYHGFFLSAVLAVYGLLVFWRPKQLLSYGLGAAVPMAVVAFYQWKAFGSPLTPGHKFVENPLWAAEHQRGLYGVILPSWKAIGSLSFDPGYGFFGMSPFMLFGLLAILVFIAAPQGQGRAQRVQLGSTVAWFIAMLALWVAMCGAMEWRAGWTLGARRAGAAPPFFALGAVLLFERISARWPRARNSMRGVALGTALVGIASLGLVGIVYNTLPEDISRPITQFALPLVRVGVVPHHNAELLGFKGTTFWYVVALAMFAAPVLGLFAGSEPAPAPAPPAPVEPPAVEGAPAEDAAEEVATGEPVAEVAPVPPPAPAPVPARRVGWGMLLAIPMAIAAGIPAFYVPKSAPAVSLDYWVTYWQPPSRDRIASLVKDVQTNACAWHWIADAQEIIKFNALAQQNRAAARVPQAQCRRSVFRRWFP
jgi:hypothetical protein